MEKAVSSGHQYIQSQSIADSIAIQAGRTSGLIKRPRFVDGAIRGFLFLCAILSILTTIGITLVLLGDALHFFASTEWINANKRNTEIIDAAQTTIMITKTGQSFTIGDTIRVGQPHESEQIQIVNLVEGETAVTLEVLRGINGTQATEHASNTPLYLGANVTLAKFFTTTRWAPEIGNFGILPLLNATLYVSFIAMLIAIPIGLGTAVYLSEYASRRTRAILKPILEVLAGIPTVVYGYFALTFMTPLLQAIFGDVVQIYNMASAGIVVGILIIPTISSISEDAINAVPNSLREASYGLGATKLETIFKVLLPAALSGISAAIILGISRAIGETMIVLLAAGAGPNFTFNPFDNAETMAGHIARISTGDLSFGSIQYNSVFAIGLTLFVMTLLLNFISTWITRRFREIY